MAINLAQLEDVQRLDLAVESIENTMVTRDDLDDIGGGLAGPTGPTGAAGPTGPSGPPGSSVSIQGSVANAAALPGSANTGQGYITVDTGHLWVWNGSAFIDVGLVRGPNGATGPTGPSAYAVAQAGGFAGTQAQWLASLVGGITPIEVVAGSGISITDNGDGTLTLASSGGGGGGDIATDTLWDNAGDLAVGSGANAATKLSKGTGSQYLRVNAGATGLEWTSFTAPILQFSGLSLVADRLPYANGTNTLALATFTAFARTLLDDADGPAMLTTLGVSTFIKTLLDDADAPAARTTVGLNTSGKGFVNHGAVAGTARPAGYASIEWYGTVTPTNATAADTWIDPT